MKLMNDTTYCDLIVSDEPETTVNSYYSAIQIFVSPLYYEKEAFTISF